ncbi:MAG TPA: ethanolamine permease [Cyclobacteriaceae bacterium]|nr:ethanolamine permease [Cyclobacteriaceae bacterium]
MTNKTGLKKALTSIHLWAISVGLVISGEYFGWNYGWGIAGTIGFLIAALVITVMYVTFIFSFTELTTSIPHAGGPFAYSYKAFGPIGGLIAGYATIIEFVFATPAIAFALGSYVHFLYPSIPIISTAVTCYVLFTLINLLGIKESATFTLVVTLLAVIELLIFIGIVAPHFQMKNFMLNALPIKFGGFFAALPFAIWFYLAIEGVAMVAEEVKDPKKNIPRGYIYGILTLMVLALSVMLFTGGITDWKNLADIDYPLPESIGFVLGKQNAITKLFASIGLFGLVASFHGIIISYSRQIFALARGGYLPEFLSSINHRFRTPHWALAVGGLVGIVTLFTGTTDQIIILSALGAVVMYIISMLSLFKLRSKNPALERPYRAPLYPWFPLIALSLSFVSLIAIVYYNLLISSLFIIGFALTWILFKITGTHKTKISEDVMLNDSEQTS